MTELITGRFEDVSDDLENYPEIEFRAYPKGKLLFYGIDEEGKRSRLPEAKVVEARGYDPSEKEKPVKAVWHDNGEDRPVTVIGSVGLDKENNNELIYKIQEHNEGVPAGKLEFIKEPTLEERVAKLESLVADLRRQLAEEKSEKNRWRDHAQQLESQLTAQGIASVPAGGPTPPTTPPAPEPSPKPTPPPASTPPPAPEPSPTEPPADQAPRARDARSEEPDNAFFARFKPNTALWVRTNGEEQRGWVVRDGRVIRDRGGKPFIWAEREGVPRRLYRDDIVDVDEEYVVAEEDRDSRVETAAAAALLGAAAIGLVWAATKLGTDHADGLKKSITTSINGHLDYQVGQIKDFVNGKVDAAQHAVQHTANARANGLAEKIHNLRQLMLAKDHHIAELIKRDEAQEAGTTSGSVGIDRFRFPWDWAREQFGFNRAEGMLHVLGERAMNHGHSVRWIHEGFLSNGARKEIMEVDGTTSTPAVLHVISQYR